MRSHDGLALLATDTPCTYHSREERPSPAKGACARGGTTCGAWRALSWSHPPRRRRWPVLWGRWLWCDAWRFCQHKKTCSTAGPLCIIHPNDLRFSSSIYHVLRSSKASYPQQSGRENWFQERNGKAPGVPGLLSAGMAWTNAVLHSKNYASSMIDSLDERGV